MSPNLIRSHYEPKVTIIDDRHSVTPFVKVGETIVIGVDPEAVLPPDFKYEHAAKVQLKGIAPKQLARAALAITPHNDGTLRVKVLSNAHVVKIWSTDRLHPLEKELFLNRVCPETVFQNIGQNPGTDITTQDGTVIRIDISSRNHNAVSLGITVPDKKEALVRAKIRLAKFQRL
jgi:hypothetical protein